MKILSIISQKPTSTGSGVYLAEVIRSLNKLGHTNAIVFGKSKDDSKFQIEDEVAKTYPITFDGVDVNFKIAGMSDNMPYPSTRYCDFNKEMTKEFFDAYYKKISKAILEFKPDIILCHHLYLATSIASHINKTLLNRAKIVAISHGTDIRQMQKHELCKSYIKEGISNLDQVYVLHNDQADQIHKVYGVDLAKIDSIGTGYNSEIFCSNDCNPQNKDPHSIIYAGKICKQKGVPQLIKACATLSETIKDLTLTLAGGHSNEDEFKEITDLIKKCSKKFKINVTGQVPQSELAKLYRKSKVFCLPSFFEGLPLVTLEAIACGCTAVMTDLPGVRTWYLDNVKDAPLIFVKPPKMSNIDVPVLSDLPQFQTNLENAILDSIKNEANPSSVENLSWLSLTSRLLDKVGRL